MLVEDLEVALELLLRAREENGGDIGAVKTGSKKENRRSRETSQADNRKTNQSQTEGQAQSDRFCPNRKTPSQERTAESKNVR